MRTNLVLTIIGDDKPGVVESLSQVIASNSGNWLESNMSQLAGKFAGILRVSVPDQDAENLVEQLNGLSDQLTLVIEKAQAESEDASFRKVELSLVGNDRPGIIREVSAALAGFTINVEELNTECSPAPMSGDTLFNAKVLLKVAASFDLEELQNELERIADDLIVETKLLD
jgi:glycine cleavage system regulatory protein